MQEFVDGSLHIFVAFDWGEEIALDTASQFARSESRELIRRPRTPSSITFRPPPLRVHLPSFDLPLSELGVVAAKAEATLFDFGAVSIAVHVAFRLTAAQLHVLAGSLANPESLTTAIRRAAEPLFRDLQPVIRQPAWGELSEEYFVFQLDPRPAADWLAHDSVWIAGLIRLEQGVLSAEEIEESLRLRISYTPEDLLVVEWAASLLADRDCEETLQVIELTNVQLLEMRHLDNRLDARLECAYELIHPLVKSWLPFWRTHMRPLRALGELKVEAYSLFERSNNVLKLVGDQYLARVHRLLAERFHLKGWEESVLRSLRVIEDVHRTVSDQAATYRTELLELTIILLIVVEIVIAFLAR